ncbi:hypothetical protein [Flagellimonas myxillae]|uniref:hypothetical protein n=1 Tax=Flagellimonas myxillae TaxID=2942214 RepID=UPI00201F59BB|nr:hypothetical protein [Muricauda myxillae]MCL6266075.1 hypothetical protein [Muricauda myxillae]
MGGEGSMMHAIKSLQQNRSLLKRRKTRTKEDVFGKESVTKLNLKKSTTADVERVRHLMMAQKRKSKMIGWIAFVGTIGLFLLFYLILRE